MRTALLILALTVSLAATAQDKPRISASAITVTVDLTGSPTTGTCPFTMNASWSAANASVCTKSGAWTGSAAASGSEAVTVNAAALTYTLTCSSNTDSRTVSWTNPTQNTDGTAATLSGNKLYHAATSAGVDTATPIVLTPAKTSYLLTGLPAGPRYIGVRATGPTPNPIDSDMSAIATTTITLPSGSDTVQAGCTTPPQPKPPTAVTISSTVWESMKTGAGVKVGRDVGSIGLGVECSGEAALVVQGSTEYWRVPRTNPPTTLYRTPKSEILLGQCELKCLDPSGVCAT